MDDSIKTMVRENYANIAIKNSSCCAPKSSCCGTSDSKTEISKTIGYSEKELESIPEGANLGLGCGNPLALASLKEGETVIDLGSGAGIDCFLAANKVGKSGKVIGVDMTHEMLDKARKNAKQGKFENVEFRLGEIENLPVGDNFADIIISNCVINLSPDKERVFSESYRVLKQGGRIMVSDIVLLKELPEAVRKSVEAYVGCIAGAVMLNEYIEAIKKSGLKNIEIVEQSILPVDYIISDQVAKSVMEKLNLSVEEVKELSKSVVSVKISAVK